MSFHFLRSSVILTPLLFVLLSFSMMEVCNAQKESNTWYFGQGAGLNFNTNPVSVLSDGQINTREGVCSISDKNGALLFYSEGTKVWDKNHNVMPNGSGLQGDFSSTQSSIVIPNPGNPSRYFLFTTALFQGMLYSEVDITLNGGNGDIVSSTKNTVLVASGASSEKIIAVQHCNKRDYWVITHLLNSTAYYVYLVNPLGVQAPIIINTGSFTGNGVGWEGVGYLKLSADGSKLVNIMGPPNLGSTGKAEIFDFNNRTGIISATFTQIAPLTFPYGAEFSLANKFVYISDINQNKIYQYDLTASDVNASQTVIASSPNISYGALQMGPDAKIYVSGENGYSVGYGFLSVIASPDGAGANCNFQADAINLNGKKTLIGLPTFAASYLKKDSSVVQYNSTCVQRAGVFSLSSLNNADSVKWDFGDGSPKVLGAFPAHTYAAAGNYNTQTIIYRSCNSNDTIAKTIAITAPYTRMVNATVCQGSSYTLPDGSSVNQAGSFVNTRPSANGCDSVITTVLTVTALPVIQLGKDTSICGGAGIVLNPGAGLTGFNWQNGANTPTITATTPGLYWVEAASATTGCRNRDSVMITVGAGQAFSLGTDRAVCAGQALTIGNNVPGALSYNWNTGATSPQIAVSAPGSYWMEVGYTQGCKFRDTVVVSNNPVNDFTLGNDTALCEGNRLLIGTTVANATPLWNNGNTTAQITVSSPGLYWQEISVNGCSKRDSINITSRQLPLVKAEKSNDIDCGLPAAQLTASGAMQYSWSPATGLTNAQIPNPVASIDVNTVYTLKGTDVYGCTGIDSVVVKVTKIGKLNFNVPNAFSPNGDHINDCFRIVHLALPGLQEFSVYNRFGEKIFSTRDPNSCWDGRFKGKMQDPGGYVYIIRATSICGDIFKKGIVMLLR